MIFGVPGELGPLRKMEDRKLLLADELLAVVDEE
jgi:hypothetical protein